MPREYPGEPGELVLDQEFGAPIGALRIFFETLDRLAPHVPEQLFGEFADAYLDPGQK